MTSLGGSFRRQNSQAETAARPVPGLPAVSEIFTMGHRGSHPRTGPRIPLGRLVSHRKTFFRATGGQ
jgi:hypothetical protein